MSWTLYGLVASQFGDIQKPMESGEKVADFVSRYFGFHHDFLGVVAAGVIGFAVLFAVVFALSIKMLNFQKR